VNRREPHEQAVKLSGIKFNAANATKGALELRRYAGARLRARLLRHFKKAKFDRIRSDGACPHQMALIEIGADDRAGPLGQPQPGVHIIDGLIAVDFNVQPLEARKTGHKTDLFYPENSPDANW
jgi:hypothetical protein